MGEIKMTTPKVSEEEFLSALEEVTDVLKGKKPRTEATEAASRTLTDYARMRAGDGSANGIKEE
jgi:hypothetical protein